MFHLIISTQKIIFRIPDPSQPTWRTNQDKTRLIQKKNIMSSIMTNLHDTRTKSL